MQKEAQPLINRLQLVKEVNTPLGSFYLFHFFYFGFGTKCDCFFFLVEMCDCFIVNCFKNLIFFCRFPKEVTWVLFKGMYKDLNINIVCPGKDSTLGMWLCD